MENWHDIYALKGWPLSAAFLVVMSAVVIKQKLQHTSCSKPHDYRHQIQCMQGSLLS